MRKKGTPKDTHKDEYKKEITTKQRTPAVTADRQLHKDRKKPNHK